jgi:hypothetical protein
MNMRSNGGATEETTSLIRYSGRVATDLRHSFVALALDGGTTLAEAAALARHANAGVTGAIVDRERCCPAFRRGSAGSLRGAPRKLSG